MRCVLLLLVAVMVGALLAGCGGSAPTAGLDQQVTAPTMGLTPQEIIARHAAVGKPVPEALKGMVSGLDTDLGVTRGNLQVLDLKVWKKGTALLGSLNWWDAPILAALKEYVVRSVPEHNDDGSREDVDIYLFGRPLGGDGLPVASIALLDMSLNPGGAVDEIWFTPNPDQVGNYLVAALGFRDPAQRFKLKLGRREDNILAGTYDLAMEDDDDSFTGSGTVVINEDGTATISASHGVFGNINDAGGGTVDESGAATLFGNAPQGDYDFTFTGNFTVNGEASGSGTWSGGSKTGTWTATPQASE